MGRLAGDLPVGSTGHNRSSAARRFPLDGRQASVIEEWANVMNTPRQSNKYHPRPMAVSQTLEIERLFVWLQNFLRLVVRYEDAENFLGMLYVGWCLILLSKGKSA
jgi:hypothetical protein